MLDTIKIATLRGAGVAFPIACLWYVFSGNLAVFNLVLVGAGLGLIVGSILIRYPALKMKSRFGDKQSDSRPNSPIGLNRYLTHQNPVIRFLSLLTVGSLLFILAWYIGYDLLPEGLFRGGAEAQMARSQLATESTGVFEEWTRIFTANLTPVLLILLGSLLIRVNGFSFGYIVAIFNLVWYGLFIGTNSFAIPYPVRLAPTFEILSRSGPYEMMALILLATSSYFWPLFEIRQIFRTNPERVEQGPRFFWRDAAGVVIGICILMAANWMEASMIMAL